MIMVKILKLLNEASIGFVQGNLAINKEDYPALMIFDQQHIDNIQLTASIKYEVPSIFKVNVLIDDEVVELRLDKMSSNLKSQVDGLVKAEVLKKLAEW
jgi:hypothetical protein